MAVSRKQRDALREQKKSAFSSMMQAVPTEANNAIDKNIAAYIKEYGKDLEEIINWHWNI